MLPSKWIGRVVGPVVAWVVIAAVCAAQPPDSKSGTLIGEEKRTRDELDAADRLAAEKHYPEAVRRYQQILSESGDALVSLEPAEPRRALPARWLVHRRLAELPPAARKLFSDAVEGTARKWLEQGAAERDERLLAQVVAEAFAAPAAEKALHLLGDLALERGEVEVAEHYWRMLARYPSESEQPAAREPRPFALVHPDAEGGGALAQAKLILTLVFREEKAAARRELESFRKLHPDAAGHLAGRAGKYADILQALLDADARWAPEFGGDRSAGWTTFGGDPARNRVLPAAITPYFPDTPTWRTALPGDPKAKPHRDSDPPLGTGASARGLAFHPVIVSGFALVADAARVFAYDLATGKLAATYDHRAGAGLPESLDLRVPSRTDASYTLSVQGDRIYARFGVQPIKPFDAQTKPTGKESAIVCLALRREPGGGVKLQFRWQLRARMLDTDPDAIFEGAPLIHQGRLYVARTRLDGRQLIATMECYDADAPDGRAEPPVRRWRQEVWSAEAAAEPRSRHDLLTLAGPNVVYCTHTGAVVALDAASGRRAWAYRYPAAPRRPPEGVLPHDLCPCVYAQGRVYAAPADGDRVLCLDARSGELVWESSPVEVVQLLGVSQGRLLATVGGFPKGIRAYHASRGAVLWTKPDAGDVPTFGRGFLTDRWVFWPTRMGLRVLHQQDGDVADAGSSSEPYGNLALGDGYLIVTTPTEIWGFVPPRANLGQLRNDAANRPASAEDAYRLALAEADAGETEQALADFRRAEELAVDGAWLHGRPLSELARHRRFELLEAKAGRLWKDDERDAARALLRGLSGEPFPAADRVRAWALRWHAEDRTPPDLVGLNDQWVTRPDGVPMRADEFLADLRRERDRPDPPRDKSSVVPQRRAPHFPVPWSAAAGVELAPFREWPLTPFRDAATGEDGPPISEEGRVFFSGPRRVSGRTLDTGRTAWTRDIAHDATAGGFYADAVIVAGADGVSRLRRSDGEVAWHFSPADPQPMPAKFPDPPLRQVESWPHREPFSAFRLAGSRLLFRQGAQRLLALNVETGRLQWQFMAPGAPLRTPDDGAGLSEHFLATAEHVLLQTTAGEVIALDAADGRIVFRHPAPATWSGPPILIDARRAVYADGPRLVAVELDTGKESWSHAPRGLPSLAGSAPQLRRDGSHLMLITERNYGFELERLDLDTGRAGRTPLFLGSDRIDLMRSAWTDDVMVLYSSERLLAFNHDGRRLWEFPIPRKSDEPWRVRATRSAFLLHPDEAIPDADIPWLLRQAGKEAGGFPTLGGFQRAANMVYHGCLRRSFPLLAISPADGRKLQEQAVPARGPRVMLLPGDHAAVVVEGRMEMLHSSP